MAAGHNMVLVVSSVLPSKSMLAQCVFLHVVNFVVNKIFGCRCLECHLIVVDDVRV